MDLKPIAVVVLSVALLTLAVVVLPVAVAVPPVAVLPLAVVVPPVTAIMPRHRVICRLVLQSHAYSKKYLYDVLMYLRGNFIGTEDGRWTTTTTTDDRRHTLNLSFYTSQ